MTALYNPRDAADVRKLIADYRDLPYIWQESQFRMDRAKLEARLSRAKLVIGDVAQTCSRFFEEHRPAPLGAILFDLDYYSSTRYAFAILDGPPETRLPRIFCYFDDLLSSASGHVGHPVGVPQIGRASCRERVCK